MTRFFRGPRKRTAPSGSGQDTESRRFADRPWASPQAAPRTPSEESSGERPFAAQPVQRRFTNQPVTPVARVDQPVIPRPVVQAKIGIGFELRDLPVDDAMPILDVTVAATRPPIELNTKREVLARQKLNKLPTGSAFRHIIAYDNLVVRLQNGLKGRTSAEALDWLRRSAPQGSIHQISGQASNRFGRQVSTNRKQVEDGALEWLKKWQNHPANLFVGSASENSSLGSDYDDPTQADAGEHQQAFASGSLDRVFEDHEFTTLDLRKKGLWFGPKAAAGFQEKARAEGVQIPTLDAENAILQWLGNTGQGALAHRIASSADLVRQADAWNALVEIVVARTTGGARQPAEVIPRYWPAFKGGISEALPQPVVQQQIPVTNTVNKSVQLRLTSRSPAASTERPRDARGPDVRIALPSRAARPGSPLIVQAKEAVDVSYELKSQPIHPTAPITSVTVSGVRPPIRAATKRTVLARYSLHQQADFVNAGITLKKGWVWRHILPYSTLAARLEAALEGKNIQEANDWLTANRPLGAPAETPVNGALSPRLQLETRALSWLDGWQNNPANLFIGSAAENSSLKDVYDDPQTADKSSYALQHDDQRRLDSALTYSTPGLPSPAADYSQDSSLFFGVGAQNDLDQQTRADSQPSLDSTAVEKRMFVLLEKTPGEDARITAEIWNKHPDGHLKLRAATGWQALISLYGQWSKGRPQPDETTFDTLWGHWWPRFGTSIREQMEKREIGVPTGLIALGGRKETPKFDFTAFKLKQEQEKKRKEEQEKKRKERPEASKSTTSPREKEEHLKKKAKRDEKEAEQQGSPKPGTDSNPDQETL
jgi:hypothetical protein